MSNQEILDEIKKRLTKDKDVDVPYLQTELKIYRELENDEVIYGICNLLFEYLDPKIKERLDLKTHQILDERRHTYETVLGLIEEGKTKDAKKILIDLVSIFEKASYTKEKNYYDFDQMIEYFIFCETVEKARSLKIKRYPEPVTYYMYQLASIYLKENNTKLAIESLEKALVYNPRCQYVMQELIILYLQVGKKEEAYQLTLDSLKYAYDKQQLAFCYQELGKYYQEKGNFDIAICCFMTSNYYSENKANLEHILEITQKTGIIRFDQPQDIIKTYEKYNLQHGVSSLVIQAIQDFIGYTKQLRDYKTTRYLLNIAIELTNATMYINQLKELEELETLQKEKKDG